MPNRHRYGTLGPYLCWGALQALLLQLCTHSLHWSSRRKPPNPQPLTAGTPQRMPAPQGPRLVHVAARDAPSPGGGYISSLKEGPPSLGTLPASSSPLNQIEVSKGVLFQILYTLRRVCWKPKASPHICQQVRVQSAQTCARCLTERPIIRSNIISLRLPRPCRWLCWEPQVSPSWTGGSGRPGPCAHCLPGAAGSTPSLAALGPGASTSCGACS